MSNLWEPDRYVRDAIAAGNRKARLQLLKAGKELESCACPYCDDPVYFQRSRSRYFTFSGSAHCCTAMRKAMAEE